MFATFLGHNHYFRFCAREDIEQDIWNNVLSVEDFAIGGRHPQRARDIFLITKRWMASREVLRVIALVPEASASQIRAGLNLPTGVAERRPISPKIVANLDRYLHRCRAQGDVTAAAARYLGGWCRGTLPLIARPPSYAILGYRWRKEERREVLTPGAWRPPPRRRHIDLAIEGHHEESDSGSDAGEINVPADLLDDRD